MHRSSVYPTRIKGISRRYWPYIGLVFTAEEHRSKPGRRRVLTGMGQRGVKSIVSSRSYRPLSLALGLFTRHVAFILAGNMAVAYFMAHAPRGFFPLLNGGEVAIVYCFVFLYLWAAGGGEWSLDRLRASASASTLSPSRP